MTQKLNILIIPGIFPFPPNDGGKICVYAFIDVLRHVQNIHLFLAVRTEEEEKLVETNRLEWSNVTIHTVREYTHDESDSKAYLGVKKIGAATVGLLRKWNQKDGISAYDYDTRIVAPLCSPNFIKKLSKLLRESRFDIVQTEYTPFLNLVNIIPESIKKVFVEIESLHSVIDDHKNVPGADPTYVNYLSENAKTTELAYMSKYDAILTLSKFDEERLKRNLPGKQVYTSSFPVLDKDIGDDDIDHFTVKRIVFMGSERHFPNKDAVTWFAEDVIQLLDLRRDINVYVTGIWSAETKKRMSLLSERIVFTGFVEDVKPLLKNSISIAPVRLGGGGIRAKLICAMAANSAVVATSVAANGIIGTENDAFIVADSAPEFADAVNRILNDSTLFKTLVKNGREVVQRYYSQKMLADRRNDFYNEIVKT